METWASVFSNFPGGIMHLKVHFLHVLSRNSLNDWRNTMTAVWIMSYLFAFLLGGVIVSLALYFYFDHLDKKDKLPAEAMRHPSMQDKQVPNPILVGNFHD